MTISKFFLCPFENGFQEEWGMRHDDWDEEIILSQVPCLLQASNTK